uniref:Uncharacterized protein n=1 Tax=Triticum urartu TaxID=4572 RepID=A0A8R7UZK7_TRIUA
SYSQAFEAAQLLATASCEHDKVVSAVDCILSLVGDKNPEHYFVATQDSGLRAKLREVPCVPVIYGLKNSLFVEQPSCSNVSLLSWMRRSVFIWKIRI